MENEFCNKSEKTGGKFYISYTRQSATLHPGVSSDPSTPLAEARPESCAPFFGKQALEVS